MKKAHFNDLRIRNKLLLIYAVCVMLPIILTDAIIMYNVNDNSKENQMRDLHHVIERVEYNLRETVDGCILFTKNLFPAAVPVGQLTLYVSWIT
jgi:two-component system sensor histidine kinase YesM